MKILTKIPLFSSPGLKGHVSFSHHLASAYILIFSSETAWPISTKLCWNGPLMVPFQNCIRGFDRPSNMVPNNADRIQEPTRPNYQYMKPQLHQIPQSPNINLHPIPVIKNSTVHSSFHPCRVTVMLHLHKAARENIP